MASDMAHLLHAVANKRISAAAARALLRQGYTADQIMNSVFTPVIALTPAAEALWADTIRA